MAIFKDDSSADVARQRGDAALFDMALLGPKVYDPNADYAGAGINPDVLLGSNSFRFGDFSAETQQQRNKLYGYADQLRNQNQGYIDQLRNQQAPDLARTNFSKTVLSPEKMGLASGAITNANAIGTQQGQAITSALNDRSDTGQRNLESRLNNDLAGGQPSLAAQQLAAGQAANARQALSMAAGARGGAGNQAAALREALRAGAAGNQDLNAQQGMLRAQEYAQARGELGGVLATERGQTLQNRFGAIGALGTQRGQDLDTSNLAFGQGLQAGQFNVQQNEFETGLRADEAKTRAQLEAQQRGLTLQGTLGYQGQALEGTLGYGQQANQIAGMDTSGRQAYVEMMSNRDLAARGLATQAKQADNQQTNQEMDWIGKIISDVRSKKNIEPADASAMIRALTGSGMSEAERGALTRVDTKSLGLPSSAAPVVEDVQGNRFWQTKNGLVPVRSDEVATRKGAFVPVEQATESPAFTFGRRSPLDTAALDAANARASRETGPRFDLRPAQGYSYEYKNPNAPGAAPGRQLGPMAQDLEKTPAGASTVAEGPRGKSIDTSRLSLVNTAAISEQQNRLDRLEAALDETYGRQGRETGPRFTFGRKSPLGYSEELGY